MDSPEPIINHFNFINHPTAEDFITYNTQFILTLSTALICILNIRSFGTNPNSKLPFKSYQRIGPHDYDILCLIFGSLLGDGYANLRSQNYGETVRFAFKQSSIHKEYLFYLYNFLWIRGYCSNNEPRLYTRKISGSDKVYYGYEFNTFSFTSLVWIYNLFYINGTKVVPTALNLFMSPLTLAIWISDDGGWVGNGVKISTHSFTYLEVEFLVNLLKTKFNLDCTIQTVPAANNKSHYQIYIKANSISILRKLLLPVLHPSMHYKLGL